jgi:hypothetical protein
MNNDGPAAAPVDHETYISRERTLNEAIVHANIRESFEDYLERSLRPFTPIASR